MAEKPNNDTEDKKISEKPDAIKKAEDIAIKYPDLDVKETWILTGLNIKGTSPEDINKGMDDRFDTEIQKAGLSGQTSEIIEGKKQLSEQIAKTTDMKEKIALYQEFFDGLKSEVGTLVAEQKQNSDAYSKTLQEAKNLGKKIKELQLIDDTRKNNEKQQTKLAEQTAKADANTKITINMNNIDWPGSIRESPSKA